VKKLVLATGYRAEAVEAALDGLGIETHLCPNPRYDSTQNSVSLALCAEKLRGESFFKLDGDLVFDARILTRLDAAKAELAVAVDTIRKLDAEAMKVTSDAQGSIRRFGKHLSVEESAGESIGIERVRAAASTQLFLALEREIGRGRTDRYYEDVYSDLVEAGKLSAELVEAGDLPWTEIDTPEDLAAAQRISGLLHTR
jgi:choline kinase